MSTISVTVNSSFSSITKEYSKTITLLDLCDKIYPLTGISPDDMEITVHGIGGDAKYVMEKVKLSETIVPFADISSSNVTINVRDTNVNSIVNQLIDSENGDDISKTSFKLSEEDYERRSDSILQWKKENKLGKFDPKYQAQIAAQLELQNDKIKDLKLNSRCSVKSPNQLERRGWLRYIGKIPEIKSDVLGETWCGIEFDEPVGKNTGSINNKSYFGPVLNNHGGFVRPMYVETGPQFTLLDSDLFSDEEI